LGDISARQGGKILDFPHFVSWHAHCLNICGGASASIIKIYRRGHSQLEDVFMIMSWLLSDIGPNVPTLKDIGELRQTVSD